MMKRTIIYLLISSLTLFSKDIYAQIFAKGNDFGEIVEEINVLVQKKDSASRIQLMKEANAMAASDHELYVRFASGVYHYLGETTEAEKTEQSIITRFPRGIHARNEAFDALMNNDSLTVAQLETSYTQWTREYPKAAFMENYPEDADKYGFNVIGYYDEALLKMSRRLIKAGNYDLAKKYIDEQKNSPVVADNYAVIGKDLLEAKQYDQALPLLEVAYHEGKEESNQNEFHRIAALYVKALLQGQKEKGLLIAQELYDDGYADPDNTLLLARGLHEEGKESDAFAILRQALVKHGRSSRMAALYQEIEPIYNRLYPEESDFTAFTEVLDKEIKENLESTYKAQMIEREAPPFSLVNLAGETVSLSDYKGKIVVLDFWATWCHPCVISFPGMQAAVNKYNGDDDVVFLFINVWQTEENYKELVKNFVAEHKYTFHVLFDSEMQHTDDAVVSRYGIDGIPTKVIIDREGLIRFQSSGGNADTEAVVTELETKIELIRGS